MTTNPTPNGKPRRNGKLTLHALLFKHYVPEKLTAKNPATVYQYHQAVKWTTKLLGRNAVLADLTSDNLRKLYDFCRTGGLAPGTIENHRRRLVTLLTYAVDQGLIAEAPYVPPVDVFAGGGGRIPWTTSGTLAFWYATTFKPEALYGLRPSTVMQYDAALRAFLAHARADATIDDVTAERIVAFAAWMKEAGTFSAGVLDRYPMILRRFLRHHRPPATLAVASPTLMRPDDPGGEKTLRWFFDKCYLTEHSIAKSTEYQYRLVLKSFSEYLGHDALLQDLHPAAVNGFLTKRLATCKPNTVRGPRVALLVFWRAAFDWGFVTDLPRRIRKINREPTIPDAFTPAEVSRLLAAAAGSAFDSHRLRGKQHVGKFLAAIIRLAYDSGLRLGDLLTLRKDQLRPDGTIVLTMAKTGHVHVCRVHASTVQALDAAAVDGDDLLLAYHNAERRWLFGTWRKLLRTAGLPVHRRNGLQKLRRTSASHVEQQQPGAGSWHLGHRSADLARRHYLDPAIAAPARLPPEIQEPPKLLEAAAKDGDAA